jgi:hypothetical protein
MPKMNEKELERFIHRTLRELPNRRAPGTLEARVLAAVEQQALVPWWHKGWAYWPAAVRAVFLAVATAVSGGIMAAGYALLAGADVASLAAETAGRLGGLRQVLHVFSWTVDLTRSLIATIPALWLYGGLAFVAALYVSLFGLGAFAYRTLVRSHS